jgi:hypothetical protein
VSSNSDSSAHGAHEPRDDQAHEGSDEHRSCFYCLEGWVFLGSLMRALALIMGCLKGRRRTEEVRAHVRWDAVHGDSRPGDNSFGLVDTAVGIRSLP